MENAETTIETTTPPVDPLLAMGETDPLLTPETKVEEKAPVVVVEKTPVEIKTAERFAQIAKRERGLQLKEQQFKEQRTKYINYEKSIQKAKEDPIAFLNEVAGMDFDTVINKHLEKLNGTPVDKAQENAHYKGIENRIAQLEQEKIKLEEAKVNKANQQMYEQHITAVSNYVEKNKEQYEVIISYPDRALQIFNKLESQHLQDYGTLSDEEVVTIIGETEKILTEEIRPLYDRLSKTSKFKNTETKVTNINPEKPVAERKTQQTLTNNIPSTPSTNSNKPPSNEELAAKYDKILMNR